MVEYLRLQAPDPPECSGQLIADMRAFARWSGLALTDTDTETPGGVPSREGAAFSALVTALHRPYIHAVVIPSPGHFSCFSGMYQAMRTLIETETTAHVLVISDRPGGAR